MRSLASFSLYTYTVIFCRINLKRHLFHLNNLFLQQVVDVDQESPDMNNPNFHMNNPNFHILYKDSSEDIIDFSQINDSDFLEPFIDDYFSGWEKFISVDRDPTSV